ncbi:MAG: GNAT family N-acetyltransferase [Faecalibacterium sp.]|jgi:L-amino acid N-acyltransferase YncA/predicted GIY-YIG superfamily endonuclease|nr:GNAT family N-acetyltransferase [Faecalibacterium sp.]
MKNDFSFVYMVRCGKGQLYTGWTNDAQARLYAHKTGVGAKYTRGFSAEKLAYLEQLPDKPAGLKREAALKKLPKAEKEALCAAWAENMRPRLLNATPADTAEILAIHNWYVENSLATYTQTPATLSEYTAWVQNTLAVSPLILARAGDGRLLGYACAHPYRSGKDAYSWDYETTIYCAPWARGIGVADALYPPLLEGLRRMGVYNAFGILTDPNPASEALHKKHGFVCEAREQHVGYKLGRWLGLTTWRLALKKGRAAPAPLRLLTAEENAALLREYAPKKP